MNSQKEIVRFICDYLRINGWNIFDPPSTALSFKTYDTAVGQKEAQVYFCGDEYNWVLSGLYESQGRNILSTASELIPKDCAAANLIDYCSQFLTCVDSTISQSYAVRLLRFD
ncbi:MAG: hypothetical protein Q8S55_21850 [Methylococcaceae bacterium]|jgi:hypothetical protein|nr:hypothetical protein [Methylococcaceae bacterium]